MKLIAYLRSFIRVPRVLEDLERRLKALENPPKMINITMPSPQGPSIQTLPYIYPKHVQPECLGGCELPSHYVGDYPSCIKCGRSISSMRTITTICGKLS